MLRPTVLGRRNTAAPFSAVLPGVPVPPIAVLNLGAPDVGTATVAQASALSVTDVRWGSVPAAMPEANETWGEPRAAEPDRGVAAVPQQAERSAPAQEAPISELPTEPVPEGHAADLDDWFARHPQAEEQVDDSPDETLWESEWNRWEESGRPESLRRERPAGSGTTGAAGAMAFEPTPPPPDRAAEVLEAVARMVRSREIVVSVNPGASTESVLASILASLLSHPS